MSYISYQPYRGECHLRKTTCDLPSIRYQLHRTDHELERQHDLLAVSYQLYRMDYDLVKDDTVSVLFDFLLVLKFQLFKSSR